MNCPKCSGKIDFVAGDNLLAARCDDCHGLWLDGALTQPRRPSEAAEMVAKLRASLDLERPPTDDLCPQCAGTRLESSVYAGVEIDWCASCRGIFLDRNELQSLVALGRQGRAVESTSSGGDRLDWALVELILEGLSALLEGIIDGP